MCDKLHSCHIHFCILATSYASYSPLTTAFSLIYNLCINTVFKVFYIVHLYLSLKYIHILFIIYKVFFNNCNTINNDKNIITLYYNRKAIVASNETTNGGGSQGGEAGGKKITKRFIIIIRASSQPRAR